ncbi:hypothetical protein CIK76_18905 [Glutamicibacter sp. BW80]|uniref:hypothetical protein n=1 Tax=Glutamicibacter sp. BW80 TaxID=2024404 RepID=UPI000BB6F130|nr:hypothetical protein [Glutamicibacter sp. BW80]PCC27064.1 hypothetical protein CIK76_18905 [Glutamicibacter sp. BW80]
MADEEKVETDVEASPWTRPWFIASAVVVGLLVALVIVVSVLTAVKPKPAAEEPASPSPIESVAPSAEPSADSGDVSTCGLEEKSGSASLTKAPKVDWKLQGILEYPSSSSLGPAHTSKNGVRSCFQHSPEGAVVAAANASVQGSTLDPLVLKEWFEYFLASGPNRASLLAEAPNATSNQGIRAEIVGFQLLNYDGNTARVDIALSGSGQGENVNVSMIYDLIWEDGDWKLSVSDPENPINVAVITDTSNYVVWKAE